VGVLIGVAVGFFMGAKSGAGSLSNMKSVVTGLASSGEVTKALSGAMNGAMPMAGSGSARGAEAQLTLPADDAATWGSSATQMHRTEPAGGVGSAGFSSHGKRRAGLERPAERVRKRRREVATRHVGLVRLPSSVHPPHARGAEVDVGTAGSSGRRPVGEVQKGRPGGVTWSDGRGATTPGPGRDRDKGGS